MNKDQAIQVILFECQEMDGFLVKLHSHREFDAKQFQKLIDAIQTYHDETIGEECISRRIAGCLFYLEGTVLSTLQFLELHHFPDKEEVAKAHAEIWNLVESIYGV